MSAARRMKKSYIRPAYANAVDGKVLYFPFVCIYNGHIRTNSGSAYNQVEAYIPFPSTAHPLQAGGQGVGRAVKANVKGGLAIVDHLADLRLVCNLRDQATCHQFVIDFHFLSPFPKKSPVLSDRGRKIRGTTSGSPTSRNARPHGVRDSGV